MTNSVAMNPLPTQAVELLHRVKAETDLQTQTPSGHTLFTLYNELLDVYTALGEEMCKRFSAKERAYISRKIEAAKHYRKGRHEEKLNVKDSEMNALELSEIQLNAEIDQAEIYEQYRTIRDSVDRAISYIRSLNSYLKISEQLPDPR